MKFLILLNFFIFKILNTVNPGCIENRIKAIRKEKDLKLRINRDDQIITMDKEIYDQIKDSNITSCIYFSFILLNFQNQIFIYMK